MGALTLLVIGVPFTARALSHTGRACALSARADAQRAAVVTGRGASVLVVGDSWSAGWRLARPAGSWPRYLPGRIHVDGFPGSGFSEHASPCGAVSYADRAVAAVRRTHPSVVVLQGGLNDFDRSDAAITAGFHRVVAELRGHRIVVVGPADAPSRARRVPRVDALLARLCAASGVPYVSTSDLALPYLPDRLHLTAAGHREYGEAVATRIAVLNGSAPPRVSDAP